MLKGQFEPIRTLANSTNADANTSTHDTSIHAYSVHAYACITDWKVRVRGKGSLDVMC